MSRKNRKRNARQAATGAARPAATTSRTPKTTAAVRREDVGATVALREEELFAQTQVVEVGAARVSTEVVAEQRTLEAVVWHEEVFVERHPVERQPAERPVGGDPIVLHIPIYGEHVTVRTRPVVVEEITVGKEVVQTVERLTATVRHEELTIETQGEVRLQREGDAPY